MPTWTPYVYSNQYDDYGTRAQINYRFLGRLWEADQLYRNDLVKLAEQSLSDREQKELKDNLRLKDVLALDIPLNVSVVVVDLENAKMVSPTEGTQTQFYVLFLPANPSEGSPEAFQDAQKWAEAWYHAVRETGGM